MTVTISVESPNDETRPWWAFWRPRPPETVTTVLWHLPGIQLKGIFSATFNPQAPLCGGGRGPVLELFDDDEPLLSAAIDKRKLREGSILRASANAE